MFLVLTPGCGGTAILVLTTGYGGTLSLPVVLITMVPVQTSNCETAGYGTLLCCYAMSGTDMRDNVTSDAMRGTDIGGNVTRYWTRDTCWTRATGAEAPRKRAGFGAISLLSYAYSPILLRILSHIAVHIFPYYPTLLLSCCLTDLSLRTFPYCPTPVFCCPTRLPGDAGTDMHSAAPRRLRHLTLESQPIVFTCRKLRKHVIAAEEGEVGPTRTPYARATGCPVVT